MLQRFRQLAASPGVGIKHLGTAVPGIGKEILMDAHQDVIFRFIHDPDPLFQIRHLLGGDGISLDIHGSIRGSDHVCRVSQQMKQIPQPQTDLQIIGTFQLSRAGSRPAIHAAMAGIDDNPVLLLPDCLKGNNGYQTTPFLAYPQNHSTQEYNCQNVLSSFHHLQHLNRSYVINHVPRTEKKTAMEMTMAVYYENKFNPE